MVVIDAHNHLDHDPKGETYQTADRLVRRLDRYGLDMSVIAPKPLDSLRHLGELNNLILEAMNAYPGRFVGFCCVNPTLKEKAVKEVQRCLSLGFKGIGEVILDIYQELAAQASIQDDLISVLSNIDSGVPVLFHVGDTPYSKPEVIEEIISRCPDRTIVMGHMGGWKHLLPEVLSVAKRHEGIYLDTAFAFLEEGFPESSPRPDSHLLIGQAITELGAERILFGTDSFSDKEMETELHKIDLIGLSPREKYLVMGGNLARLLRIEH